MRLLLLLSHLSCLRCEEVAGPHGFSEVFKMPGASFKLELQGPFLTSKDRAIIRESGGGCPGRQHTADSEQRSFSLSVATYVYHSQGSYEPSPLVHGGPIIAGANTPGWLKASWYPVQLRMAGSYRICYCAASDEMEFAQNSGVVLGPNDSPCELDYASYRLVGVAYAMGIKHSEVPIGSCLVSNDGTLQGGCQVQVRADRGGLSAEDMAELVSGNPSAICGETPAGTTLLPLQGDAFAWKFQVPSGAETQDSYEFENTEGLQRVLKICYCEKQSMSSSQFAICSQSDWQNAGSLSLVGFDGSPVVVRCYRGQRCRLGRPAFGMSKGDAAIAVPGNSSCSNLESFTGTPAPISILGGSTAVANIDVETYEGDLATICFCSAGVHGIFGCQTGQAGRVFSTLMGYVRSGGLKEGLRMDCVPTSANCPETAAYLTGEDALVAQRGKLFLAELKYRPCEDLSAEDVQQAKLLPGSGDTVQVEMPWPMASGRYAICFCEDAIGCPQPNQVSTLQHIGELRVLGAIDSVGLTTHPGVATIPLQVKIVEHSTGIRCCADSHGTTLDCVDLRSSATAEPLSYPGSFRFPLVLQKPLDNYDEGLAVNVSCAALGETGPCAAEDGADLSGFPCRQVHPLQLQLQLPPASWRRPWRRPVGAALGAEAMAEAGGYATQLKAVATEEPVTKGICKNDADKAHFASLPCQGAECIDLDAARAVVPGHYELCVCEPGAVPMSQECMGWHHLGHLEIYGPLPLNSTLQGTSGETMHIHLQGVSLGQEDSLVSVPLNSAPVNSQTVCVGEGRLLPTQSTLHSPADWSASNLRFDVSFPEGIQALCWLPPGNGMLPYYLGFAEIFGERINIDGCLVTPWQLMQPCSASCGAGKEIWYRRVLGILEPNADCSVFEEERFCMKSPCEATVERWETNPAKPKQDEAMELLIAGANLSNDLYGVLVADGEQQSSSPNQGLCHYASKVAGLAKCSPTANTESQVQQVCSFPEAPPGGDYQVCVCMAPGPRCQSFLPALGTLRIEGLGETEEDGGVAAAIGVSASLVLLACLPLLSPRVRRKLWWLWKRLKRRIFKGDSKVMALPGAEEDEKADLEDADLQKAEQDMEKVPTDDHSVPSQVVQPEEEPSQCSTPRMDPNLNAAAVEDDVPTQPEVPEEKQEEVPEGCKTPEDLEAPTLAPEPEPSEASEKSRKERKREKKEERRKAREEKREEKRKAEESALLPAARPLPPPPLRAPPRKLPSLPVSPSLDVRSPVRNPAALEALAEATQILQANNMQKDGKLTDYGLSMKALSAALGRKDPELVAKALGDAERAGVGRELLQKARQHLAELRGETSGEALDGPTPAGVHGTEPERDEAPKCVGTAAGADDGKHDDGKHDEKISEVVEDVQDTTSDAIGEGADGPGAQEVTEPLERQEPVEARAPEPPADLGRSDAALSVEPEARVEKSRDGDAGVAKETPLELSKMDETAEPTVEDLPEASADEIVSGHEGALPDEAEEKDQAEGEPKVDSSSSSTEPASLQSAGGNEQGVADDEGKHDDEKIAEEEVVEDVQDTTSDAIGEGADGPGAQEVTEPLERQEPVEARAPEPPADLGRSDAALSVEPEARVEKSRDGDAGVAKETPLELSKMDETAEPTVEDLPEASADEIVSGHEGALPDEAEEKDQAGGNDHAPAPLGSEPKDLDPAPSALDTFPDFPFSPLTGGPSSSSGWQSICKDEEATIGTAGDVRFVASPTHRQEESVEVQVASPAIAEGMASVQPDDQMSKADDLLLSLSQERRDWQRARATPRDAVSGATSFRTHTETETVVTETQGWAASVYRQRQEQGNGVGADASTPVLSQRGRERTPRQASSSPEGDEFMVSLAQRLERVDQGDQNPSLSQRHGTDASGSSSSHRQQTMDLQSSRSRADDFAIPHRERLDRQTSGGRAEDDLFSLARQERTDRQTMGSSSGLMIDRQASGMGAGLGKEKRKSTPIRPSLTGSTLVDGGTLMLWKSGDDSSSRTKTPPPPPPRPAGPSSRPGSAMGSSAQRAGSQRAGSKRSS